MAIWTQSAYPSLGCCRPAAPHAELIEVDAIVQGAESLLLLDIQTGCGNFARLRFVIGPISRLAAPLRGTRDRVRPNRGKGMKRIVIIDYGASMPASIASSSLPLDSELAECERAAA